MNITEDFKNDLKNWLQYDNEEKSIKDNLKNIKDKKIKYEDKILSYMENNNLTNKDIILDNDCKIKYKATNVVKGITKKLIYDKLKRYFNSYEKAEDITNYIYSERESDLKATALRRTALYKCVVAVIRSYANIKADLEDIYNAKQVLQIESRVSSYLNLREIIRRASNEVIDLKAYEADMRHLIDTYIQASDSEVISQFNEMPMLWIITSLK